MTSQASSLSLIRFLSSLFFGTIIVIIPISLALVLVSRVDPLERGSAEKALARLLKLSESNMTLGDHNEKAEETSEDK
jgi:hypothetical protein